MARRSFRDAAQDVGIKLNLTTLDENTLGITVYNTDAPDWDIFVWGWDSGVNDPNYLFGVPLSSQIGGNNDVFYCNRHYDALYNEQATELDRDKRLDLVHQMQQIYYDDARTSSCGTRTSSRRTAPIRGRVGPTRPAASSSTSRGPITSTRRPSSVLARRVPPPYMGRKLIGSCSSRCPGVVTFNFLLFRVLPGDPIQLYARSGRLTPEAGRISSARSSGWTSRCGCSTGSTSRGCCTATWASRSRIGGR